MVHNGVIRQKELVKQVDIVMTMVGYPHDVEEVYFGIEGIIEHAKRRYDSN